VSRTHPPHLLVERALALIPDHEEFLPLTDAVVGASRMDRDKQWARSGTFATLGKRRVDADRLAEALPAVLAREQARMQALYTHVVDALRAQQAGDAAGAAATLVRAGEREEADGRTGRAREIYLLALDIARDLREKRPQVLALRRLGRVARATGRLEEAWGWYEQSYHLAVDQQDLAGQGIACQGLGNLCDDRGERDGARDWYERGLGLAREAEDAALQWPFYANLAVLALLAGELDEAEALLDRARTCIEESGAGDAMRFWLNNRGLLLMEHGDAPTAEAVFREALRGELDPQWEVTLRVNLGDALLRQDRLLEAEEEARRAEETAILNRLVPDLVDVYVLLGKVARERSAEEGFVFYEEALRVCRERMLPRKTEASVLHGYGLLHASCGRPEEARAYLEAARDIYRDVGFAPELARLEAALAGLPAAPAPVG
jgi:tetratricopeptide (TPR) repeat protein